MNIKSEPLVSVVLPVYNGAKYLDECIQSVLDQTYSHWELIIQNNSSTDNTLIIAKAYAARDNRIRVFNTDSLLPIMQNWNLSLSRISPDSSYCKVVHADDFLYPPCITSMVAAAQAHPTVGLVGAYSLWGDRVVCDGLSHTTTFLTGAQLARLTLLDKVYCFWSPSSLLIRSDIIRRRGNFYGGSHLHADVEACYETLKESDFGFVHQVLTFIRRHEESMTAIAAVPLNKTILSNLDLLNRYGPLFLSSDEFNLHWSLKTRKYYNFLAHCVFELRDREFWYFHRNFFKEYGIKFKYSRFLYVLLSQIVSRPKDRGKLLFKSVKQRVCHLL